MSRPKGSRNKPKDQTMSTKTGTEIATVDHAPQKMMLLDYMADKYSLNTDEFSRTVRAVCGMPTATPEQFAAFLLVAKTYDLNPLIKEIYAFPAKGGGIVPIVSIDGWVNLVNSHPACDGYQFETEHDADGKLVSYTCTMYRKDRKYPVNVTEYLSECKRATEPWKMEHRMLRHKSMIQAARYAFGFAGIYDPDEGEKIATGETDSGPPRKITQPSPKQIEATANPPADAAPPRSTAPDPAPGEDHAAGEVQDATPPRRTTAPPKEQRPDPITTGPQTRGQTQPKPKEITPFKIPGTGETFESWAEKYIDNIYTAGDTATAMKWIDLNSDPLARLAKGKPSVYANIKKSTERLMEQLRDAQAKAQAKAAAKTKPTTPPPSEMDDGAPADEEMESYASGTDFGKPADDNPETILKWIDDTLARVDEPEDLENIWVEHCEPKILDMFPPDKDEAQGIYRRHEKRLAP